MRAAIILIIGFLFPAALSVSTGLPDVTEADTVAGQWLTAESDAIVELMRRGNKYFGRISWMAHPYDDKGELKKDFRNPDPALRERHMVGLEMMHNFVYDPVEKKWIDGTLYNTRDGKTYNAVMWLEGPDILHLKGYAGVEWFGKSTTWTRRK